MNVAGRDRFELVFLESQGQSESELYADSWSKRSDYAGRFCSRGQKGSIDSAGNPQRCGAMSVASSVVLAQARAASEGRPRQTLMYEINSYIAPQKLSVAHYWA